MKENIKYLKSAIKKSEESFLKGFFPVGAIIVKNGKIISSEISTVYPDYKHAELKAIDKAFSKLKNSLESCVLYSSLEPCLMCLTVAYWAGIRKIIFACDKQSVSLEYFESNKRNQEIIKTFQEEINFIQIKSLRDSSLEVIRKWEKINN
ncbi:nucleoside deaminase [Candidatus Parcubacteria bacterium]|nr:nucleoside deaminase [Candidatus Parcubacteria bacterium]